MKIVDIRKIAEQAYRAEHPRIFPFSPYERQAELSDLWEADQEAYVKRVAAVLNAGADAMLKERER